MSRRLGLVAVIAGCFVSLLGPPGCSSEGTRLPEIAPGPQPPVAPRQESPQFQIVAPRETSVSLAPAPEPPLRLLVQARERIDGTDAGADRVSEGLIHEVIQAEKTALPPEGGNVEILNRDVYEKALGRDLGGLRLRKQDLDAEILRNLGEAGADVLVLGEIDTLTVEAPARVDEIPAKSYSVESSVSFVRTDSATTLGVGTGSGRGQTPLEAKRAALQDAARKAFQGFREARQQMVFLVHLTVEGLRDEGEAARTLSALRAVKGVVWVRNPQFQLGPKDSAAGIARYEVGWNGEGEDFKKVLRDLNPGFRLRGTRLEGNRWNFRAEPASGTEPGAGTPPQDQKPTEGGTR